MSKKTLMLGTVVGTLFGSLLAGGAAFAATKYVQAQYEGQIDYGNGVKAPAFVYNNTQWVELYAIQQSLKKQGVDNTWDGKKFGMNAHISELTQQVQSQTAELQTLNNLFAAIQNEPDSEKAQAMTVIQEIMVNNPDAGAATSQLSYLLTSAQNGTLAQALSGYNAGGSTSGNTGSGTSGDTSGGTSSGTGTSGTGTSGGGTTTGDPNGNNPTPPDCTGVLKDGVCYTG